MKRKVWSLILIFILALTVATQVQAGGDQVRGDEGAGSVNQNQVMDPPPFQTPTP